MQEVVGVRGVQAWTSELGSALCQNSSDDWFDDIDDISGAVQDKKGHCIQSSVQAHGAAQAVSPNAVQSIASPVMVLPSGDLEMVCTKALPQSMSVTSSPSFSSSTSSRSSHTS